MTRVTVRVGFGNQVKEGSTVQEISVDVEPTDSVLTLKQRIAEAAGGSVTADDLLLRFGPNDRKIGRQYAKDPTVDESKLTLNQFSWLAWMERFPHWTLTARLLPPTPPPPGVAIHKAAATAEHKDPDQAVADARAKGSIPRISDLPAPWGTKPYQPPPESELTSRGYLPAKFPGGLNPLQDVQVA